VKAVVQRVTRAKVSVDGQTVGAIAAGLVVLLAVGKADGEGEAQWMANKIAHLRIFEDEAGKFNRSIVDVEGQVLLVSQFTLYGDVRKGRRPSFTEAAHPELAEALIARVAELLMSHGVPVASGKFQAHMLVEIHNDGPVTIILEK
jgi:D-tyrosyl-tRNA(Tyr) deacylase